MAFNKVILQGRLTADVELKQTQNGTSVASFTIAVDRNHKKEGEEKKADFISVVAWKQTAEFISRYFGKGSQILLCGELQTRSWEDQNGQKRYATEVVASEVSFCGAKNDSKGNNTPQAQNGSVGQSFVFQGYMPDAYKTPSFEQVANDDNLPF